jgi:hypothetical protein
MGRTARFEQIYVANLDAEPVEEETLTGVKSILTREVEANELLLVIDPESGVKGRLGIANTTPSKSISVADKLYIDEDATHVIDLKSSGRASRWFVDNQISIGTTNPTNAFQIDSGGSTKVAVDLSGRDLMTVNGNLVASNLILSDRFTTSGSNLIIQEIDSNVVTVAGGIKGSNLYAGSNVGIFDQGSNVLMLQGNVYQDGDLNLVGNIAVTGNLIVTQAATYIAAPDLRVSNALIHHGFGNSILSKETGLLMTPGNVYSNVAMAFVGGARGREMAFFQTDDFAGQQFNEITIDDTKLVNVHVYGDIYTSNNIGANNTFPTHDLCVGSNVFIDDTDSNVIYAHGNVFAQGLILGPNGLRVGNLLTMIPGAEAPVLISSNIQMNSFRTTGTAPSGISNLSPTDTLSVGAKIFANTSAINSLRILGNTATTNLTTEMVFSSSNLVVHADRFGGDSTSNVLVLKSGPTASNVSSIEVYGASTTATQQKITMKTKNTERIRITSDGKVGISNTGPTERLTVSGNIYVIGSNTISTGNIWGSTGNIAMRAYTSVPNGETRVENIVGAGKGLKFFASTTPTMGTPKLTLLESSNVGINVASPVGRLHTSGGTVFLNDQPTYRNGYSHLNSSLVVTNTQPIVDTTDLGTVLHLAREGNATRHGVRASFKLGKHDNASGKSKTKMDIYLADEDYTDEVDVLTLQSEGRVGIGTTQPTAHLEVYSTGTANPLTNGILVHNHESPSGDAIIAMQTDINEGNAFTSYIQTDADVDPTGWAVGVSGSNDFRITQNPDKVYDAAAIGVFIDGTSRDVGIGTDVPRGALEVNGNVVIGQELTFSGLVGDEFGNTRIIERRYTAAQPRNELVLFKGNNSGSVDQGPDRIRHIAAEHVFQTYNSSGDNFYGDNELLDTMDNQTNVPITVTDLGNPGIVVIGGNRDTAKNRESGTRLVVNGDIEFDGGGSFKLSGLEFSTSDLGYNIIRSVRDGATRRPLTFVHELTSIIDSEFARFDEDGRFALGTDSPTSNIHVYDTTPDNIDLLRLQSTGINKQTGALLYTNDGEGGFLRGFSNTTNKTTGLALGVSNNSTIINNLNLIHTSNVGVGTPTPARQFHVVDHRNPLLGTTGVMRVESKLSNASVEFTTSSGTSNIYADTTGNVYIEPSSINKPTTFLRSTLDVEGDLLVGGNIDFSQIAVNLGGEAAATDIETGGGIITSSNQVSRKTYAHTFSVGAGDAKDIQILFDKGAFFAKIVAMLRRTDNSTVEDLSTMILEVHGGTGNASNPSLDVAVGTKNVFGGTNSYPWSSTVTTGQRGISIVPYNIDVTRVYSYDISIELMSSCGGKVTKVTRNLTLPGNLDNGLGGQAEITTFTY